jgi:FkbM family methyltransferase
MKTLTFDQLQKEHEKLSVGLQYTIAERERLKVVLRIIGDMMESKPDVDFSGIISTLLETPAERYQDIFALLASGGKRNGYFVEFGACDGLVASNTLMLERHFGWRGLLAEPDRFWKDRLPMNRTAAIDTRCVSSLTGQQLEFYQSDRPGNSSPDQGHIHLGNVLASYSVETVSLLDLLNHHKAPPFIDFLSVDTEGHEKDVFANFDFDLYKFGFICVEEHEGVAPIDSVQPIIESAGYRLILPRNEGRPIPMQIAGIDKFFVLAGHPAEKWVSPRF